MPEHNVSGRVLIADDDALVRALVRQTIEPTGMTIFEAANGREALLRAGSTHIDLAILDLVMPEMDGLETMRELLRRQPGMKIIIISGALPAHYLELAGKLGAARVFAKPIPSRELLQAVSMLLGGKT